MFGLGTINTGNSLVGIETGRCLASCSLSRWATFFFLKHYSHQRKATLKTPRILQCVHMAALSVSVEKHKPNQNMVGMMVLRWKDAHSEVESLPSWMPNPRYERSSFWPSLLPAVSVVGKKERNPTNKKTNKKTQLWGFWTSHLEKVSCLNQSFSPPLLFLQVYTRLPGQQITVNVTLFLCSFSIGTSAEWLMPTVESPFTATIISPHLRREKGKGSVSEGYESAAATMSKHFSPGLWTKTHN